MLQQASERILTINQVIRAYVTTFSEIDATASV